MKSDTYHRAYKIRRVSTKERSMETTIPIGITQRLVARNDITIDEFIQTYKIEWRYNGKVSVRIVKGEVEDLSDSHSWVYKIRRVSIKGGKSFETTVPIDIVQRLASKEGISIEEFLQTYKIEWRYNGEIFVRFVKDNAS